MGAEHRWLVLAVAAAVEVAVALSAGLTALPLSGLLLLGPVLTACRLSARSTAAMSGIALALVLALPSPTRPDHDVLLAPITVATVGAWATLTAHARVRAERALAQMTQLAETAQQALARPMPDEVGGVGLATHTRCADAHARLGGDVHDAVLALSGTRLLLADVKGHGVQALLPAAAVLAAFRRTAATEPDPVRLAHTIDQLIRPELGPEDFVTLLLVDFRPGEARIVNCGHPPPLRVDFHLHPLTPPQPSPPLGLNPSPQLQRVRLTPDQRLLLHTDGLTEARNADRSPFPLDGQARAALNAPTLSEALQRLTGLLDRHTAGRPVTDDLTLILAQHTDKAVVRPVVGPNPAGDLLV